MDNDNTKGMNPKEVIRDELFIDMVLERADKPFKRDKSKNTPEFNKIVRNRRTKAKQAKAARKKNRGS